MIGGGISRVTVEVAGKIAASLGASLRSAQTQVSSFGRNVSRTMNDAATAGRKGFKGMLDSALWQQATVGATAFAGAIGLSVREAMKFDSAMADIRKAIDFADGEKGAKRFGRELIKLSTELPYTAEQLTKIAAAAGFAGYAQDEIIPFTKSAAAMGVAFQMTAEQAGDAMVALRAQLGITQPEVLQLGDAINYLSDKFQGTVNAADLVEVTRRIGAIGKSAGLAKEEIAGLGAAFLASGTPTEIAATGLKNFLNALTKNDQVTKKQVEALETLFGADVSAQLAKNMQTDAEGTIKRVIGAMAKLAPEKRVSIAGALFGEESKSAIMPLLTNTKLIDQAFDLIADKSAFAGSMQKEFQNQMGTSAAQAKIFQNGIQAVGISVGTALLPSLNSILKAVTPLLVQFGEWAQKNEGLVTNIVLVGGALAGLVIALPVIAGVISAIGTIGTAIGAVAAAFPVLAGIGTVLAVAGGPITLIIAGIVGLGLAFKAAYDKVSWFRDGVNTFASSVRQAFGGLVTYIGGAWKFLTGILTGDTQRVQQGFTEAFSGLRTIFSAWAGWVTRVFQGVGRALAAVPNVVGNAFRGMAAAIQLVTQKIVSAFQKVGPAILSVMFPIPARIYRFFTQTQIGQQIVQTIINGLKARASALFSWISGTWARIKSLVGGGGGDAPAAGPQPPGRATGGPVRAGFPYIVGERRRELFVPGMDGAIIPRIARPITADVRLPVASQQPAAAPITINAPVTINAAGGDAMGIRDQVRMAFEDLIARAYGDYRVALND